MTPGGRSAQPEVWDGTSQVRRPRSAEPPGPGVEPQVAPRPSGPSQAGVPPTAAPPRASAAGRLLRLRTDAGLAERFAAGDQAAFSVLYERHRRSVLAVCVGVLGGRDDAEDAAQECFAALAQALRKDRPRDLRAWLVRVARNAAIDVRRRRRTQPAWDDGDLHCDDARAVPGTGARPPAGPHDATRVGAELESVLEGIRELPEAQRTALLMRELAGHSYREIGEVLGIDEQAVRGLIARARVGLREHRAASELPCAAARATLASEPRARIADRTVRRHVHGCASCRAYRKALRGDAQALRALLPAPTGGLAGGGAVAGLAAKGAFAGGVAGLGQLGAACAASICTVGAVALLYPHNPPTRPVDHRPAARMIAHADHRAVRDRHFAHSARTALSPPGPASSISGAAMFESSGLRLSVPSHVSGPLQSGGRRRTGTGSGRLALGVTGAAPAGARAGESAGPNASQGASGTASGSPAGWSSSNGRPGDGAGGNGSSAGGDQHGGWGAGSSWQPGEGSSGTTSSGGGNRGGGQSGPGHGDGGAHASSEQGSGGQGSGGQGSGGQGSGGQGSDGQGSGGGQSRGQAGGSGQGSGQGGDGGGGSGQPGATGDFSGAPASSGGDGSAGGQAASGGSTSGAPSGQPAGSGSDTTGAPTLSGSGGSGSTGSGSTGSGSAASGSAASGSTGSGSTGSGTTGSGTTGSTTGSGAPSDG